MPHQEDFNVLEEKVLEIEPRIKKLEECYERDIQSIFELLRKIEIRVAGGGLDDIQEIGLITKVRDIKMEIANQKIQLDEIEKNVFEIKNNLPKNRLLMNDIEILKNEIKDIQKYKYMAWGGILACGWMIAHYTGFIEIIKHGVK